MINIKGAIDKEGRCKHYQSPVDIIAIKFKCCNTYYSCIYCHLENAAHLPEKWDMELFNQKAILCGECMEEMSISSYLSCDNICPHCSSAFNPKCKNHYHFYFNE